MVTQFVVAVGLLLSLLFVACSDGESAPRSGDETAAQVVPDPAQTSASDEVSETTADPEPGVPTEQAELDADESPSEATEAATDEPLAETPASEEPASEEPATDEPAVPLPDWAVDAVELTVERRLPGPDERLLALWACTHCDGATGEVGSWVGADEPFGTGLEYSLFSRVVRGSVAVAVGSDDIALLVCNDGCGFGVPVGAYSVYLSSQAGWFWEEIPLPGGTTWSLDGFTSSGEVILQRFDASTPDPEQFHLVRRTEFVGGTELVPVDAMLFDRNRLDTAPDANGLRWSAANSDPLALFPRFQLLHGDDVVRDFEPYTVVGLALNTERSWVTAGLICGARGPAGPDLTQCHDSFLTNAYLLNVIGDTTVAYKTDLASVLPDAAADTPGFHGLRWQQRRTLWAELVSFQPLYAGRPVLFDFVSAHVTIFREAEAGAGDVTPLSYGPARDEESRPLRSDDLNWCGDLFPMPRLRAGEEPLGCVTHGASTGEVAVDAEGNFWSFIVGDDISGWILTRGSGELPH